MPQTLENSASFAPAPAPERVARHQEPISRSLDTDRVQDDNEPTGATGILTIGGTSTGAALLGGILAGPIGALVGTVAGLGLGFYLQRKSKA